MKRFIKLEHWSLFNNRYVYMDHDNYPGDSLFIQNKLHVKYGQEFRRNDSPWRVITVTIAKKDSELFEHLMETQFEKHLLLLGYVDYPKVYQEMWINKIYPRLRKELPYV